MYSSEKYDQVKFLSPPIPLPLTFPLIKRSGIISGQNGRIAALLVADMSIPDGTQPEAIKVVLLGDPSVGKTSLRSQYLYRYFSSMYKATIGADFLMRRVRTSDDGVVDLQIWDTAGQERFNAVSRAFYRGADVGVVVYDITNAESFYHLAKWVDDFVANCGGSRPYLIIVGNKRDNKSIRQISYRQAAEFAAKQVEDGLIRDTERDVVETSAKRHQDTVDLFSRCAELGAQKLKNDALSPMGFDEADTSNTVDIAGFPGKQSGCC